MNARTRSSPQLRHTASHACALMLPALALCLNSAAVQAESSDAQVNTITVLGKKPQTGYLARNASVAGGDDAPLLDTPASVSVLTRELLDDQQAQLLSSVLRNDASVGDSYAPVGYYENFEIRGFALDLASS